jgi:hypothetical protein
MPEGYGLTAYAIERLKIHEEISFTGWGENSLLVDWCNDINIVFGEGDVVVKIPLVIEEALGELILRRHMERTRTEPIDLDKEE